MTIKSSEYETPTDRQLVKTATPFSQTVGRFLNESEIAKNRRLTPFPCFLFWCISLAPQMVQKLGKSVCLFVGFSEF